MNIKDAIEPVTPSDYLEITDVWEASVRATHHFLPESDILYFRPLILNEYLRLVKLSCIRNEAEAIVGFSGTADGKLEMLFIRPDYRGRGVGKRLLLHTIEREEVTSVDVNEQNPQAVEFYLHMGFEEIGRSETDGLGKPYPLLHLAYSTNKSVNLPQLSSDRLLLEPFSDSDEDLFLEINTAPFVRQYLWDDEIIERATARNILAQNRQHFTEDGYGLWKIILKDDGACAGYAGLWYFFEEPQPQLIYALRASFAGQGIATEAARAVMDYAFVSLEFDHLLAATDEPHLSSQKLARRLGMALSDRKIIDGKVTLFFFIDRNSYLEVKG